MSLLDLYTSCQLCPRNCKADRQHGQTGFCHMPADLKVARAALHMWEEPCISGKAGSGAIFFSGCSVGCVFCQNHAFFHRPRAARYFYRETGHIFLELQTKGANNINLVTPEHYAPSIALALAMAKAKGLHLPIICNCSGYSSLTALRILSDHVNVWLPDFKYYSPESYPENILMHRTILQWPVRRWFMYEQAGDPVFDDNGIIQKGIIVRHLTLPGCMEDSRKVIHYLHETYGDKIYISIMNQFTPVSELLSDYPELNHTISASDYDALVDYAIDIGVENGFIQEGETAKESFIPPFDNEGV